MVILLNLLQVKEVNLITLVLRLSKLGVNWERNTMYTLWS
jgi:hypothetical protein